ncbi:hypothetical protein LS73_004325 [Helicobacter muridarum]|uniref:Calcineurin-like phosphoesterase domain-containing protein n=2 Tax=Helicobacter muridarum TaxID=216 RepID=A0A4U8TJS9_9HELI|nr:metallophosphoesterase [Helicobacter muridarum]TLE00641.1 hypothetical protein LS73_004325 [Helicobacter muridarum]
MTFIRDIIMQEDAVFIADSHFKQGDIKLIESFLEIPKGKQIFLMGDIFHLLVGALQSSQAQNEELIRVICELSFNNEIIFIEGNHDFKLKYIWEQGTKTKLCFTKNLAHNVEYKPGNIRIYEYQMQPIILNNWKGDACILAHGDLWINPLYNTYRKILSSNILIGIFRMLDKLSCGIIYRNVAYRVSQRMIGEFSFYRSDFREFMLERIMQYQKHIILPLTRDKKSIYNNFCIIEGHFHIGKSIEQDNIQYVALPSSYFTKTYTLITKVGNDNGQRKKC